MWLYRRLEGITEYGKIKILGESDADNGTVTNDGVLLEQACI